MRFLGIMYLVNFTHLQPAFKDIKRVDMHWVDLPRVDEPEQIDDPAQPLDELALSMGDVACSNRWFGGTHTIVGHIAAMLGVSDEKRPIRVLDIGTGSADIPRALIRWGRDNGWPITVVGIDNLWNMLEIARSATPRAEFPTLHLAQASATALPFAPGWFDFAVCGMAFHHLGFDASAQVLAAMDRLTTRGFVVTDLRRDRLSLAMVETGIRMINAHPFTRHDGPASVRRAFTKREYAKLIAVSGVTGIRIHTPWYYRIALVKNKASH